MSKIDVELEIMRLFPDDLAISPGQLRVRICDLVDRAVGKAGASDFFVEGDYDADFDKLRYDLHRHVSSQGHSVSPTDAVTDALHELRRRGLLRKP